MSNKNPLHIARQFDSYRKNVIPEDAPEVQVSECRLAFYAGAVALRAVLFNGLTNGPDATTDDVLMLLHINEELEEFGKTVGGRGSNS